MPYLVSGHEQHRYGLQFTAIRGGENGRRDRKFNAGNDVDALGMLSRLTRIDAFQQCMCVRTAKKRDLECCRQHDVVDIFCLPHEELGIFAALAWYPDVFRDAGNGCIVIHPETPRACVILRIPIPP